jgi:hypothetical protein
MAKPPKKPSGEAESPAVPYEKALLKAFEKLTSEVLLFLLAYMILLIGSETLAPSMSSTLRGLLYIIPILGVGAHVWLKRTNVAKAARDHDVEVSAGITTGSAQVTGLRGPASATPASIKVSSGFAGDHAQVTGVDHGPTGRTDDPPADEQYMLKLFRELDDAGRRELVSRAMRLSRRE